MEKPKKQEEHIISNREKRAWQASKKRPSRERPKLSTSQSIEFLDMVARMASQSEFERRFNLSPGDVMFYKKELDVETQDEARMLHRQMKRENAKTSEATIVAEHKRARAAEAIAQERLKEIEARRNAPRPVKTPDSLANKNKDADRQRRFAKQQSEIEVPAESWQLPVDGTESQRAEQIDRLRREIVNRGLSFVRMKYSVTNAQIKFEARRLGLEINWEIVRR